MHPTFATLVFGAKERWIFWWIFYIPALQGSEPKTFWEGVWRPNWMSNFGCWMLFGAYSYSLFDTEIAFRQFGYHQKFWESKNLGPIYAWAMYLLRANWITWILSFDFTKAVPWRHSIKNKIWKKTASNVFFWQFDGGTSFFRCPFY